MTVQLGDRIRLISMGDDPDPIPSGSEGTVNWVGGMDQIGVKWDNGRTLMLVTDVDRFTVIGRSA